MSLDTGEANELPATIIDPVPAYALRDLLWPTIERIEERSKRGSPTGIMTGLARLDDLMAGWDPGDLIVVAGRPSSGKSALALTVALNATLNHDVPVALFCPEVTKEAVVQRLVVSEGRVDANRLRRGVLSNSDYERLARAAGNLSNARLWVADCSDTRSSALIAESRRLVTQCEVGLIVIDYIQLFEDDSTAPGSRTQQLASISRNLKRLARDLRIPILAVSQCSRAAAQRDDPRPVLTDMRDSGTIEDDADVVILLHRPEMYESRSTVANQSLAGLAEAIVAKQRHGPTGVAQLFFHASYCRFDNLVGDVPETRAALATQSSSSQREGRQRRR